jgi:hypothetical protein
MNLLDRVKEPSSWAGLGIILSAISGIPQELTSGIIVNITGVVAGVMAILKRENKD